MAHLPGYANDRVIDGHRDGSDELIDWSTVFDQHRGWLRKILRCRIGDMSEVEDCLQEIALAIVTQANRPVDGEKIPAWLYRLTIRQSVNFHRRIGRRQNLVNGYQRLVACREQAARDPLEWLIHCEEQSVVQQAMATLRPGDREILILKYTENWSYKQLAEHLGVGINTVEYRLIRAKKYLRQLLSNLTRQES